MMKNIIFAIFLVVNFGQLYGEVRLIKVECNRIGVIGFCTGLIELEATGDSGPFTVELFLNSELIEYREDFEGNILLDNLMPWYI